MIVITPQVIINAHKVLGNKILKYKLELAIDNETVKKGNNIYDTTWIPIVLLLPIEGTDQVKEVPLKLHFEMVLTASKAHPPSQNEKDKIKNFLLMFKEMSLEEICSGDYVPKSKESKEEDEKEEMRIKSLTKTLYDNTKEFTIALGIIEDAYEELCEQMKKDYIENPSKFKFTMAKESSWLERDKKGKIISYRPIIRSIRQLTRKDEKNKSNVIPLDTPLYRLKMPVKNDKMLLSWKNKQGGEETKYYIYDGRKTCIDKRNNIRQLVPAKIRSENRLRDLDINNVGEFLTYKSIVSGDILFNKIVISKQGISIANEFRELIVRRHRSKLQSETTTKLDTLELMKGTSDSEDDDTEEILSQKENQDNLSEDDISEDKSNKEDDDNDEDLEL